MNLRDFAELPPWLRYLLAGITKRHLLREDLRLILQTQLPASWWRRYQRMRLVGEASDDEELLLPEM